MKRCLVSPLCLVLVCTALLGVAPVHAQSKARAEGVPEIPYDSVPNFLKLPPNVYLGEGIGVASNSKGHVFVYTRSGDTRLFEFDQAGAFVREIGQGLYGFEFAHAVRVDSDDNIWAVDEGTNMVIKFNPEGRVVMVLGRRPEATAGLAVDPPGQPAPPPLPYVFSRPTDVGWDAAGNIFVTDGYGNSRVVKFDRNGRFVKEAGARGSQRGQLNLPHTMATDAAGNVYVGDRGNARVQVFDNDLNVKAIYDTVGNPWAVCVSPGPHQYLFVSNSLPDNGLAQYKDITGEIYKMELDGTIVGRFGKAGKQLKEFSTVHEIDCRNPNELLVSEITAWRVQKIILRPQPAASSRQGDQR
jgi:NHL repeat